MEAQVSYSVDMWGEEHAERSLPTEHCTYSLTRFENRQMILMFVVSMSVDFFPDRVALA